MQDLATQEFCRRTYRHPSQVVGRTAGRIHSSLHRSAPPDGPEDFWLDLLYLGAIVNIVFVTCLVNGWRGILFTLITGEQTQ